MTPLKSARNGVLKKELPSDFECSGGHYFEELIRLLDGFYVLDVTDGSKNKKNWIL